MTSEDGVESKLSEMAKAKKIENVPLTISKDGEKGPAGYDLDASVAFTIVVYDGKKHVTDVFAFDALDAKSQDAALAAFAKVLGVDPPKAADDSKKDAPKKDDSKKEAD